MNKNKDYEALDMRCVAIILSGGTGSRVGADIPKQYMEVNDRMMITNSIAPFLSCEIISDIQIVADNNWQEKIISEYGMLSEYILGNISPGENNLYKFHGFSMPGDNRQLSVYNALSDINDICKKDDLVVIHDAARPFVSERLIRRCINAIGGFDGVMPVINMRDTIYYCEDGRNISKLLERDKLVAGQTPEVFVYGKYMEACENLMPVRILDINGSSEPAIIAGLNVTTVQGDENNYKITTMEDFEKYRSSI